MRPLSDIYPKSLIPVPRHFGGEGETVPNLFNSIEVILSSNIGTSANEILIVASEDYFKRSDYLYHKESVNCKITEVVNHHASWTHLNNQHSMRLVLDKIKDCNSIMVVEGDVYLRNLGDYLPMSRFEDRSYYCCSYRNKEWVFVNKYGQDHFEIVKGVNGLAMAGLSIINGKETIDRLRDTLDHVADLGEFWDESLMRLKLSNLTLINVDSAIQEFDTVNDLILQGLHTPESLAALLSSDGSVEKTDSMTNTSYIINYNGVKSVLRIPGFGTEEFISRPREDLVQRLVNESAGHISPRSNIYGGGIKIAEFVEGCRTSEEKDAYKVISLLDEFHKIDAPLDLLINLVDEVKDYEKLYDRNVVRVPDEYEEVAEIYKSLISSCQHQDVVLCHRDLDPRNILIRGDEGFLVDFEYSGLLNRYWDFGAHLSEMRLHFGSKMTEEEYMALAILTPGAVQVNPLKLKLWRGIVDFVWSCWTLAKISLGEDYEDYFKERWEAACEVLRDLDMISL